VSEFEFINDFLSPLAGPEGLGLKDDAACYTPQDGYELVLTKDTMVEGIHFPTGAYGADTAERLIRTNLSDLAAKAAEPLGYLLSLAFPKTMNSRYRAAFAKGLEVAQQSFPPLTLWGGDTVVTDGPMVISATLIGQVKTGEMVRRDSALAGDDVWVTGPIGDAYLGLQHVLNRKITPPPTGADIWAWEEAYLRPQPRLDMRDCLIAHATAAADISDGLLADGGHIALASGVSLSLNFGHIPLSKASQRWMLGQENIQEAKLGLIVAGDDYEIIFTAPKSSRAVLQNSDHGCVRVGTVESGQGVFLRAKDGENIDIQHAGYKHF